MHVHGVGQGLLHSEASLLGWQTATYLLSLSYTHKHLWHLVVFSSSVLTRQSDWTKAHPVSLILL